MIKGVTLQQVFDELARRVLVCDGAMGTMLYASGVFVDRAFEELNLAAPDRVASVHGRLSRRGVKLEPHGRTNVQEAERYFREHAEAFGTAGVDLFMFETFRAVDELRAAVRATGGLPVVAQMTIAEGGSTPDGVSPEAFTTRLTDDGVDVVAG